MKVNACFPAFFRHVVEYSRLPEKQVRALCRRAQKGDPQARQELMEAHIRLIIHIARRFHSEEGFFDMGDLIQQGGIGFLHAIDKFNPTRRSKGKRVTFATYAHFWIAHAMRREYQNRGRTVAIPADLQQEMRRWRKEMPNAPATLKTSCLDETARTFGVSIEKLKRLQSAAQWEVPLDAANQGEEGAYSQGDTLLLCEDPMEAGVAHEQEWAFVQRLMTRLPSRQQTILELFYGFRGHGQGQPSETIAQTLGITPARVQQLRWNAIRHLRRWAREERPVDMASSFIQRLHTWEVA